ncbi:MAG: hypothetical protein M4D80_25355 [Myxococcota bacterium]|nr:hypothetical protein [Myxococcota bacterium]
MLRPLALVVLIGCGGDGGSAVAPECNALGSTGCVLPWPSAVYQREDTTSPTGFRLDLPLGALPVNFDGIEIDPARINQRTGFSPMSQILLTFPGGVDGANLVGADNIAASVTDESPTVILDMSTGERVAHFAEIDVNEIDKLDEQVLYLRPAIRLKGKTRYAVAIKKTLRGKNGELESPAGFRAMRDGDSSGHARLDKVRARFPQIIAALATADIAKDDLVVAFDFDTADDQSLMADPLAARDAAMAVVGNGDNVTYTVKSDAANPEAGIARIIRLEYLTPQIADLTGKGFHRGADGKVVVSGTTATTASIVVPSCATVGNKAGIVIYGHGFFGGLDESTGGYIRSFAKATCNVVVGGLWRGMTADDVADAVLALNDLNKMHGFGERIWQGMVDFMTLTKLARGKLATEVLGNIVDPARTWYYGISQGHILGSTFFAYDPTLTRAVLGVGGANWAVMFERSKNWAAYSLPLKGAYSGVMNSIILQQVIEMGLELVDGATIAPAIRAGGVPGAAPNKQYLQQMSMGDCSVPNLASEYQARTLGFPLLGPSVKTPYGFTATPGPFTGSAFVIMNEAPMPLPPTTNETFNYDNVAHENLRRRQAAIDQIVRFTSTGEIATFCTGECDCAAGKCGVLLP